MATHRAMPILCPVTFPISARSLPAGTGYANTLSSDVSNIRQIASGGNKTAFSFALKARDRIPGSAKVKVQYFNGQVTMVKDGGTWKISDMSAKKTGEHVE